MLEPAGMARKKPTREPVSYDRLIKVALQRYYPDLAAWLLGEKPVKSLSQKSSVGPRPSERPGGKERERGDLDGVDR